jgi:hypothetical protein
METISIQVNIVRPSVNCRSDDTNFGAGTFSCQDPVHSWKAGPSEVMTVENVLCSGTFNFLLAILGTEIESTVHVALPKRYIN